MTFLHKRLCLTTFFALSFVAIQPISITANEAASLLKSGLTPTLVMQSMKTAKISAFNFRPWERRKNDALEDIPTWVKQVKNDYPPQDNSPEAKMLWAQDLIDIIISYIEKVNAEIGIVLKLNIKEKNYIAQIINLIASGNDEEPQELKSGLTPTLVIQSMKKANISAYNFSHWERRRNDALEDIPTWVKQVKNDYPPQDNSPEAKMLWTQDLIDIIISYIEKVNAETGIVLKLNIKEKNYIAQIINLIASDN